MQNILSFPKEIMSDIRKKDQLKITLSNNKILNVQHELMKKSCQI